MKIATTFLLLTTFAICFSDASEQFKTEASTTRSIAFNGDSTLLAYGGYRDIQVIKTATKEVVQTLKGDLGDINEIAISGNRLIAIVGRNIGIWDIESGERIVFTKRDSETYRLSLCRATGIAYVGGGADGCVEGWDIQTGERVFESDPLGGNPKLVTVSPDGKTIAASPKDYSHIILIDAKSGNVMRQIKVPGGSIRDIIFNPSGKSILVNRFSANTVEIDLGGSVIREIEPDSVSGQLTISDDGKYLIVPAHSRARKIKQVLVLDIASSKLVSEFDVPGKVIFEAKLSPDNSTLVAATKDEFLYLFPVELK